ncbi:putative acetyltransferase [Rickettsiales bacterium Ac37b]|nr:putative acetyltransferase [Rickettsiales bacterium Ac37b]
MIKIIEYKDLLEASKLMSIRWKKQSYFFPGIWQMHKNSINNYSLYLKNRINNENNMSMIEFKENSAVAVAISQEITPPEVYDPGLTCLIDSIVVKTSQISKKAASNLLTEITRIAERRGIVQNVIDVPIYEKFQAALLSSKNYSMCSKWWIGSSINYNIRNNSIDFTQQQDIKFTVALSALKRTQYEKVQPLFWKKAVNSDQSQYEYFMQELHVSKQDDSHIIMLTYKDGKSVKGFITGYVKELPVEYEKKKICVIDDFMVLKPELWLSVGKELYLEMAYIAFKKGAVGIKVVCGTHDIPKIKLMQDLNLMLASNWWTKDIRAEFLGR